MTAYDEYNIFEYDIHTKQIISNCVLKPTDVLSEEIEWLWATNNKYFKYELNSKKTGKWMLFPSKEKVNLVWNKIKEAVKEDHLWTSKVSTTKPDSSDNYAIMVYTKDYTHIEDVIDVLNYLETSGLKPPNVILKYKTDEQTKAGIYSGGKQKPYIYTSDTIRVKHGFLGTTQSNTPSWRIRTPVEVTSQSTVEGRNLPTTSSKKM